MITIEMLMQAGLSRAAAEAACKAASRTENVIQSERLQDSANALFDAVKKLPEWSNLVAQLGRTDLSFFHVTYSRAERKFSARFKREREKEQA